MGQTLALDELANGLSGFGHPIRIRALALMLEGEITPRDLAEALGEPLGVVAYHVRMLRGYGLVTETRVEPRRGALAHYYECTDQAYLLFNCLADQMDLPKLGNAGRTRRFERLAEWAGNGKPAVAA